VEQIVLPARESRIVQRSLRVKVEEEIVIEELLAEVDEKRSCVAPAIDACSNDHFRRIGQLLANAGADGVHIRDVRRNGNEERKHDWNISQALAEFIEHLRIKQMEVNGDREFEVGRKLDILAIRYGRPDVAAIFGESESEERSVRM
jgi:hypothetical protein